MPYKLPLAKPEHDLRDSEGKHGSFLPRMMEVYIERPAKFNAIAEQFCRDHCDKVGEAKEGSIIFC